MTNREWLNSLPDGEFYDVIDDIIYTCKYCSTKQFSDKCFANRCKSNFIDWAKKTRRGRNQNIKEV